MDTGSIIRYYGNHIVRGRHKFGKRPLNNQLLNSQTTVAVNEIDAYFESKMAAASMFEQDTAMQALLSNATTQEALAQDTPEKSNVMEILSGALGSLSAQGVQEAWVAGAGLANTEWAQQILSNKKPVVSDPHMDEVAGKMIVSVAAPIYDDTRTEILGFAGFDVYLDGLNEWLASLKIGEGGYMEVFDSSSNYIYSIDSDIIGTNVADIEVDQDYKDKILSSYAGPMTFTYDGIAYTALAGGCENMNWGVTSNIPTSELNETRDQLILIMIILSAVILVVVCIILSVLVKKITKPLSTLTEGMKEFASGNLGVQIDADTNDEVGVLADSVKDTIRNLKEIMEDITHVLSEISGGNINLSVTREYVGDFAPIKTALEGIIDSLNTTLGQINQSSAQVSVGADQVSQGAQELAQGATEQAATVQELADTLDKTAAGIKENAGNAQEVNEMVIEVGQEMGSSNEKMQSLVQAMKLINDKSNEISKIIKTIEDIAFQTNILALNAAVEAARAGEAGKGFAVVADEVRSLASKSSEASNETTTLIEASVQSISDGMGLAEETASALMQVAEGAEKIMEKIGQIADRSQVQSAAIEEVTAGVDQISTVVQSNSATAEESAAASEELSGQAQILKDLVEKFKLKDMSSDTSYRHDMNDNSLPVFDDHDFGDKY